MWARPWRRCRQEARSTCWSHRSRSVATRRVTGRATRARRSRSTRRTDLCNRDPPRSSRVLAVSSATGARAFCSASRADRARVQRQIDVRAEAGTRLGHGLRARASAALRRALRYAARDRSACDRRASARDRRRRCSSCKPASDHRHGRVVSRAVGSANVRSSAIAATAGARSVSRDRRDVALCWEQ